MVISCSVGITVLPTRVLGLPQSIEIDQKPDKKFRQGFIGAPVAAEGSENRQQVPSLARSPRGVKFVSYMG